MRYAIDKTCKDSLFFYMLFYLNKNSFLFYVIRIHSYKDDDSFYLFIERNNSIETSSMEMAPSPLTSALRSV